MTKETPHILVVDDDNKIRELIKSTKVKIQHEINKLNE